MAIGYEHCLSTSAFLEDLASNWQAAVLRLGSLVLFSSFFYQRGRRILLIRAKLNTRRVGAKQGTSLGSTAIRSSCRCCCFFCFRFRCMSPSAQKSTTKNARSQARRRSLSGHSCFRLGSGRQLCKPGRRNISRSRSRSCSPSSCASRAHRNRSRSNRATKRLGKQTSEQHAPTENYRA